MLKSAAASEMAGEASISNISASMLQNNSALSQNELERQKEINENSQNIFYSKKYFDELYEYRHVILPKQLVKYLPKERLMEESEWRSLGVQQSVGWVHYLIHKPEPHILLFKRLKSLSNEASVANSVHDIQDTL